MPLFWPFVVAAGACVVLATQGRWLWALVTYLIAAALWLPTDMVQGREEVPMIMWSSAGRVLAAILWPVRVAQLAVWEWRLLTSPRRFSVSAGVGGDSREFGRWSEALIYARREARERNAEVHVFDRARHRWTLRCSRRCG